MMGFTTFHPSYKLSHLYHRPSSVNLYSEEQHRRPQHKWPTGRPAPLPPEKTPANILQAAAGETAEVRPPFMTTSIRLPGN